MTGGGRSAEVIHLAGNTVIDLKGENFKTYSNPFGHREKGDTREIETERKGRMSPFSAGPSMASGKG
ncbi:hypothetical protein DSCA_20380 [Desulfosarcina alkanivorans]|uniref:Uncharacterized protein n=1 Tax=Desulfosarcina alkanivorans TaxID=571177 RepID=A0A5K7YGB6_9BACT|nr:hypothetical protein DSCA_20380 [Desulfosarcina alkanivorans]